MVNINNLKGKEIRKIIELENEDGNVEQIIIKNPNKKVRDEFTKVMTDIKNNNGYYQIEYLIKELTNIEMTVPLVDFLKNEYIHPVMNDVLKEISSILFELVKELSFALEVEIEMDEAQNLLTKTIKDDIQ